MHKIKSDRSEWIGGVYWGLLRVEWSSRHDEVMADDFRTRVSIDGSV